MIHQYRIEAYALDAQGQNTGLELTKYADSPEQARMIYNDLYNRKRDENPEQAKYLVRLYTLAFKMIDSPAQYFVNYQA